MGVLPIPPTPIRAIGARFFTRPTIFSVSSSRPKQARGGGGGDSPGWMLRKSKIVDPMVFEITDLV